jgi:cytochrome c oxidase cbb3-type subunit I/II
MRSIKSLAVGAGFGFVTLAIFVQGFLPAILPESRTKQVSRAVRTDLGEVKWVRYESSDYTPLEQFGRAVYVREGCWYCHSQYVRPVAGEELRWGPVSEAGEYAFDLPHLFSTRRIGPDLTRVGLKYADDWHYAHHWDPRLVVPESIMPSFKWLFEQARVPVRKSGEGLALEATPAVSRYFTMNKDKPVLLFPNETGLAFVRPRPDGELPIDGRPVLDLTPFGEKPPALTSVLLVVPTKELVGLVGYVQKLGTNRGAWREVFEPQNVALSVMGIPQSADLVARGKEEYAEHCIGCHGAKGDGNGLAATFLFPRPRDFTIGAFKFRSTPSGSLPTDGDLFRTVTRGVRWTAMPTWHELPDKERLAVVTYIKTFSPRWKEEKPEPPVVLPAPPPATPELLARGKELYVKAKCWECHGDTGRGDGPSADQLKDDLKFPIRPADFTKGQFKGGSHVADIYRTMTLGLDGTPMPSFADSMNDAERWAISYFVLSFSAWADPLTGQKLQLSLRTKASLNSPDVRADHPRLALDPERGSAGLARINGRKPRVYYPGIQE